MSELTEEGEQGQREPRYTSVNTRATWPWAEKGPPRASKRANQNRESLDEKLLRLLRRRGRRGFFRVLTATMNGVFGWQVAGRLAWSPGRTAVAKKFTDPQPLFAEWHGAFFLKASMWFYFHNFVVTALFFFGNVLSCSTRGHAHSTAPAASLWLKSFSGSSKRGSGMRGGGWE